MSLRIIHCGLRDYLNASERRRKLSTKVDNKKSSDEEVENNIHTENWQVLASSWVPHHLEPRMSFL